MGQFYLFVDFSKCSKMHKKQNICPHSVIYDAIIHWDSDKQMEHIISFYDVTKVYITFCQSSSLFILFNEE